MRKKKKLPSWNAEAKQAAALFDGNKEALAAECQKDRDSGMSYAQIADKLNRQEIRTKTGREWGQANVSLLLKNPKPPAEKPKAQPPVMRRRHPTKGKTRRADKQLRWVAAEHPELEKWRVLAVGWLKGKDLGLGNALQGIIAFIEFLVQFKLPVEPAEFFLSHTKVPNLFETAQGKKPSRNSVALNNMVHSFLEWVLVQPDFCEENDFGRLETSPAFRNPVSRLSASGLLNHVESVRTTLPYGYIEELREMIAEGPNFCDWIWAQGALGVTSTDMVKGWHPHLASAKRDGDDFEKIGTTWFEVDKKLIDESDPDCVWRSRERFTQGGDYKTETIYEMWSPVRWVALLVKLQLPLRTFQVRMLDSGEADTWRWQGGEWKLNQGSLALGSESKPYANGVFLRPTAIADGAAKLLLHVNTNKTADIGKEGNQKGYDVPWMVDGPRHQNPFYWFEKLRRWQEKYNPLSKLTRWKDLDNRHVAVKSDVQLAAYPDTAFLFRTPETTDHPDFPLTVQVLDRPWFLCLQRLEQRLEARGETLPGGRPIRLLPELTVRKPNNIRTLFPLHSLRVSLITALAIDGEVPLAILQKIAGHSRLVMTLYYTKPGVQQAMRAIQAGVERLNEFAGDTIVDWLANAEYAQIVKNIIANSPTSLAAAIPAEVELRTPAGWMVMVDGLCLVGGNTSEAEASGCHNGGANIGSPTAPRYAPTPGGPRNCPRCRWFITMPAFLPQLAARWNNVMYHCTEAKLQVVIAERRFRELDDWRAEVLSEDKPFEQQKQYVEAERQREQAITKFDNLTMTVAAVTKLITQCSRALKNGDETALVANGGTAEFEFAIEEADSELLQLSGVCEGCMRRARTVENSLDKRRRMRQAKPAAGRRDQPDEGADGSRCFATFQGNSSSMRLAW
ncbi:gamma-mobile-trio integrase GmtZ [Paraburkholderia phenoliruptrix]|uniref:gamma-mobile-trio integrase GmtZ n=1 Tax=Paraburkholderia phenoliruptrix TaxID=252970 RepID=UPI0028699B2C|nr:VPA1269 family protein [Paraburkholderia phenoliruptrix]WMY09107.1 VPA1269 family protein [Paraburkholderia phenoliruptrix]